MRVIFIYLVFVFSIIIGYSQKSETYMVIIGGGKSYSDAVDAKNNYLKILDLQSQIISRVELVKSDTVQGLNPGFYIAIIGYSIDEYKATLVCNLANKYTKGIYKRKVFVDDKNIITLNPKVIPFSGEKYEFRESGFSVLKEINGTVLYKNLQSLGSVIVKNDVVIFEKQQGLLTLKYYIAWIEKTKEVVYLNQFQFSRLFLNNSDWKKDCTQKVDSVQFPESDFSYTIHYNDCNYNNGVKYSHEVGYEWDIEMYSFPISKFGFNEVLAFYYSELEEYIKFSAISLSNLDDNGNYESEYYNLIFKPGVKISFEEPGFWTGIRIEKGYIIYYNGGGA